MTTDHHGGGVSRCVDPYDELRAILRFELSDKSVGVRVEEVQNLILEPIELLLGPFELEVDAS